MKRLFLSFFLFVLLFVFSTTVWGQDIEHIMEQRPMSVSGGLSARALFYNASGIENRRKPFSYLFTGAPVLSLYGITVPFYFVFSEQERSFRQPFNQFGMSPQYKWITVHAGYRNITYSPFTMSGHTILGAGVDLNPGIFRFSFISGRLNKATAIDTVSGSFDAFSYTRKGYAAKIGIGKEGTFLDFSFLKAKDDSVSIGEGIKSRINETGGQRIRPAENAVLGVSTRVSIKRFFFEADGGLSFYTYDIGSSLKIPDSFPKIIASTLGNVLTINGSSEFYAAYNAAIGYKVKTSSLKIQYRKIEPDFKSMGAYFFNNDLESITVSPSFSLLKQKVNFSGSIGVQKDNLKDQKEATSKKVIGSGNLSVNFTDRLGIDAAYTNFSTHQKPTRFYVSDTFLITQTTKSISLSPRFMIIKPAVSHVFLVSWNYTDLVDLNKISTSHNEMEAVNMFFNYQMMLNPQNISLYVNLNKARIMMAAGETGNQGVTLGGNKTFLDNKFSLGMSTSVLTAENGGSNSFLLNNGLQMSYRVNKHHTFSTQVNHIGNYPDRESKEYPSFDEIRGEVAYMVNF